MQPSSSLDCFGPSDRSDRIPHLAAKLDEILAGAEQSPPLLQLTNIVKSYGGVRALRGVSFDVRAGEAHAIIGENGAGKSTLIKTIAGAIIPDSGTIQIAGHLIENNSPALARQLGVAVVYQQPSLFSDLTVSENLALRMEPPSSWRRVNWRERRRKAADLLADVGARISPSAFVRDLSMPQQQLLEIASAIGSDVRVLILDEPTASLGDQETENLINVIHRLRARGVGLIYISHRLEELPKVADRVTVLRDGTRVDTLPMAGIDRAKLIRLMVGRDLEAVYPKFDTTPGKVVLETRQLCCKSSGVRNVNLIVRAGEIVGLAVWSVRGGRNWHAFFLASHLRTAATSCWRINLCAPILQQPRFAKASLMCRRIDAGMASCRICRSRKTFRWLYCLRCRAWA